MKTIQLNNRGHDTLADAQAFADEAPTGGVPYSLLFSSSSLCPPSFLPFMSEKK